MALLKTISRGFSTFTDKKLRYTDAAPQVNSRNLVFIAMRENDVLFVELITVDDLST